MQDEVKVRELRALLRRNSIQAVATRVQQSSSHMPHLVALLSESKVELTAINSFAELAKNGVNIRAAIEELRKRLSHPGEKIVSSSSMALTQHFINFYEPSELTSLFSSTSIPARDACVDVLIDSCARAQIPAIEFSMLKIKSPVKQTSERAAAVLASASEKGAEDARDAIARIALREMGEVRLASRSGVAVSLDAFRLLTELHQQFSPAAQ